MSRTLQSMNRAAQSISFVPARVPKIRGTFGEITEISWHVLFRQLESLSGQTY